LVTVGKVSAGVAMALDCIRLMAMGTGALPNLHEEAQQLVVIKVKSVSEFHRAILSDRATPLFGYCDK